MDGLGSPEHMIDHSMMDLKSNPYTWNSSPKIPYDVFQSNRAGELYKIVTPRFIRNVKTQFFPGINLGGMKAESLWHSGYAAYGGSPVNYGSMSSPNLAI